MPYRRELQIFLKRYIRYPFVVVFFFSFLSNLYTLIVIYRSLPISMFFFSFSNDCYNIDKSINIFCTQRWFFSESIISSIFYSAFRISIYIYIYVYIFTGKHTCAYMLRYLYTKWESRVEESECVREIESDREERIRNAVELNVK